MNRNSDHPIELTFDETRCPTCGSPEPRLHPAAGAGGEITHFCRDPFHGEPVMAAMTTEVAR
jgi:hypothetical protein